MLNQAAATARLSREMLGAEQSIAQALVDATALMHSCALAARDNEAPVVEVQAAFLRTQKMTAALVEARGEAARTHTSLLSIYREVAATETPELCPEPTFTGAEYDGEEVAA